jgi:hypothetical protein
MQEYLTHDNGSRPFKVIISSNKIEIYKQSDADIYADNNKYTDLIMRILECERIFIGDDPICCSERAKEHLPDEFYLGNSILIHIKNNSYVYVGDNISQFESFDYIVEYWSPIGNNDVPYPYAIGETFTYLMLESKYIENNLIWDPYQLLYGVTSKDTFKHFDLITLLPRQ